MKRSLSLFVLMALMLGSLGAWAQLKPAHIFSSHMVLQRNETIKVWGTDNARQKVSVTLAGQTATAKANKKGQWMVELKALKAGGPYEMVLKGSSTVTLKDVLVGDVWICSGQSNMEWPLGTTIGADEEIATCTNNQLRHIKVPIATAYTPQSEIKETEWKLCTPQTAGEFTAVGYYFGKKLQAETGVPIGLINSNWGGTIVEAWTPLSKFKEMPEFAGAVEFASDVDGIKAQIAKAQEALSNRYKDFDPDKDAGNKTGQYEWLKADFGAWEASPVPCYWEQEDLPDFDGTVWYQLDIELTEQDVKADAKLNLGAIDDSDISFWNGEKVGETWDQYQVAREYTVPQDKLKVGKNSLVVRVVDTGGGGGIYGKPSQMQLITAGRNIQLAGTWKRKVGCGGVKLNADSPNLVPSRLYNAMIHPVINFPIKGAIWYQGEANVDRAKQYATAFPAMIESWRAAWNKPELPFYYVQLANFMEPSVEPQEHTWAELREAQLQTLSLANTGMACIIDIGEAGDIHPRNKLDVGNRLARIALHHDYGKKDLVYSGPLYKSHQVTGNKVTLTFDHVGKGLVTKSKYGYVNGFAVAGADNKFHWAKAEIVDGKVVLYSNAVSAPVAVRYGWATNPDDLNLYNSEGLPASPFRTDAWPALTDTVKYKPEINIK